MLVKLTGLRVLPDILLFFTLLRKLQTPVIIYMYFPLQLHANRSDNYKMAVVSIVSMKSYGPLLTSAWVDLIVVLRLYCNGSY